MEKIAIIGAGQAGATVAARLRALGHAGSITLFGQEPVPPYERPPLSKAYLLGKLAQERLFLRPAAFYADHDIDLRLGLRIDGIDRVRKEVRADGGAFGYDRLVLTTGARPVPLPAAIGGGLRGVHLVRTLGDVEALAADCRAGARAVVVGGGYIGLEAAAVLRGLDMPVTLVELAPRILQRVAAGETADYFRALHQCHGVEIREGTGVARLEGNEAVERAVLTTGEVLPADLVVVGIGVWPDDALARDAGIATDNGILVDARGQTSDPSVWAAGDCTVFPHQGRLIRLESVQNAIDQAQAVAANLMGAEQDYVPVPWFWSDQFDVKLQIAGLNHGHDSVAVRPGKRPGAVSHWYYAGNRLLAVDAMNDPRAFMSGKRLIESGSSPSPAAIADPARDLKTLLPA